MPDLQIELRNQYVERVNSIESPNNKQYELFFYEIDEVIEQLKTSRSLDFCEAEKIILL